MAKETKSMSKTVHSDAENQLSIVQTKAGGRDKGRFTVIYGDYTKTGLNWMEAAHEYGECLFHSLEGESKLVD